MKSAPHTLDRRMVCFYLNFIINKHFKSWNNENPAAQCSGLNIQSRSLSADSQSPITLGHNYLARLDNFIMITCVIWSGSFQTGILQNWFTETDG